jgi:hypothetical protein
MHLVKPAGKWVEAALRKPTLFLHFKRVLVYAILGGIWAIFVCFSRDLAANEFAKSAPF